ncbi:MAG: hypothetical protein BJ554DRAFT_6889 [Olpidium bornovanus]|uniref:Uncharacterized protein n=1 Tax=Olpidium bornovanus TaxID=278681 RepID=A0A8H7ZWX1_9FUNG|nr:MAG: hypothetical protein BJ554DRAFT_6889 [Olpidium bornovanus]
METSMQAGTAGGTVQAVGRDASGPPGELYKEIYTYRAPWPVFGLDWSKRPGKEGFRLAVTSFLEDCSNKVVQCASYRTTSLHARFSARRVFRRFRHSRTRLCCTRSRDAVLPTAPDHRRVRSCRVPFRRRLHASRGERPSLPLEQSSMGSLQGRRRHPRFAGDNQRVSSAMGGATGRPRC